VIRFDFVFELLDEAIDFSNARAVAAVVTAFPALLV
jgi:hypothetical protein